MLEWLGTKFNKLVNLNITINAYFYFKYHLLSFLLSFFKLLHFLNKMRS